MTEHELDLMKRAARALAVEAEIAHLPEELQQLPELGDLLQEMVTTIREYDDYADPVVDNVLRKIFVDAP